MGIPYLPDKVDDGEETGGPSGVKVPEKSIGERGDIGDGFW